jgi:hypothetical protein
MINFKNIEYLKFGNNRQRDAYIELKELKIFEKLNKYNPLLAGTIPIEIDLPQSDLDIICYCENHDEFSRHMLELFENKSGFSINSKCFNGIKSTIAKFTADIFDIEIFGQNIPTNKQKAYKHMIIEYKILKEKGSEFQDEIRNLKLKGLKTEAAFAKLLGLKGNPYEELLKVEI